MRYFNLKTNDGIETVDELNPNDFKNYSYFKKQLKRLVKEYHMSGMPVYTSRRSTKEWKK